MKFKLLLETRTHAPCKFGIAPIAAGSDSSNDDQNTNYKDSDNNSYWIRVSDSVTGPFLKILD